MQESNGKRVTNEMKAGCVVTHPNHASNLYKKSAIFYVVESQGLGVCALRQCMNAHEHFNLRHNTGSNEQSHSCFVFACSATPSVFVLLCKQPFSMSDVYRINELFQFLRAPHEGDEEQMEALRELRDRALRHATLQRKILPAESMFFEACQEKQRGSSAKKKAVDESTPHLVQDAFDLYTGMDVIMSFEESFLSQKFCVDENGINGLPSRCQATCLYCGEPINGYPWPIYKHQNMYGLWECHGLFCTPGCTMRFLSMSKLVGMTPSWKSNTALIIRRRMGLHANQQVPLAPHLQLREDKGGPLAKSTWLSIARGFMEVDGMVTMHNVHAEWAPNGFYFGKEGCATTVITGENDIHDVEKRQRWIMGCTANVHRHHEKEEGLPSLCRKSMRRVHASQRASELFHDPESEEAEGGRDRIEFEKQKARRMREEEAEEKLLESMCASGRDPSKTYVSEQIVSRDTRPLLAMMEKEQNEKEETRIAHPAHKKRRRKLHFDVPPSDNSAAGVVNGEENDVTMNPIDANDGAATDESKGKEAAQQSMDTEGADHPEGAHHPAPPSEENGYEATSAERPATIFSFFKVPDGS